MVNLDLSNLDTIGADHLRVLQAIEQGMRNHRFVPLVLITQISNCPSIIQALAELHRLKLVACWNHTNYQLTYLGYDYLALSVLRKRGIFDVVGTRIGVGKEADVYTAVNSSSHQQFALKFHKLGLTSFKTAKEKRNYLGQRKSASWMYMSRLAALREFGFQSALSRDGYRCPKPYSLNRHCVVMEMLRGFKMAGLRGLTKEQAEELGWEVWWRMVELLERGVVHGDLNEYNVIVAVRPEWVAVFGLEAEEKEDNNQKEDEQQEQVLEEPCEEEEEDEGEPEQDVQDEIVVNQKVKINLNQTYQYGSSLTSTQWQLNKSELNIDIQFLNYSSLYFIAGVLCSGSMVSNISVNNFKIEQQQVFSEAFAIYMDYIGLIAIISQGNQYNYEIRLENVQMNSMVQFCRYNEYNLMNFGDVSNVKCNIDIQKSAFNFTSDNSLQALLGSLTCIQSSVIINQITYESIQNNIDQLPQYSQGVINFINANKSVAIQLSYAQLYQVLLQSAQNSGIIGQLLLNSGSSNAFIFSSCAILLEVQNNQLNSSLCNTFNGYQANNFVIAIQVKNSQINISQQLTGQGNVSCLFNNLDDSEENVENVSIAALIAGDVVGGAIDAFLFDTKITILNCKIYTQIQYPLQFGLISYQMSNCTLYLSNVRQNESLRCNIIESGSTQVLYDINCT